MSAEVESRRFRTWETGAQSNVVRSWWLLVRYQFNRYIRTWYVYMILILGIFGAVLGLFLMSIFGGGFGDLPTGAEPDLIQEGPMAFIGIAMILFALLVTAPSIAEDLRFNAQLFYFSKPLRVRDYMLGKNMFNFIGMAIVGLVPVLILSATVLVTGPGDESAIRAALARDGAQAQDIEEFIGAWKYSGVDTWADAFYLAFMPVAAVATLAIGLVGLTMMVSSFTRRAWHAAVGTVVIVMGWSVLGAVIADGIDSSRGLLFYPLGWIQATVFLPFQHRFPPEYCWPGGEYYERGYCGWEQDRLIDAGSTISSAHMLLVLVGIIGITIAWLRMKRAEGAA